MMASLYQSSSPSSAVTGSSLASIDDNRFMLPSRETAEQQRRVALRIDTNPNPAPFESIAFAGNQVFDRHHIAKVGGRTGLYNAQRKPEFERVARERNRRDHAVGPVNRFLCVTDDVAVINREKSELAGLLQCRVVPPHAVE